MHFFHICSNVNLIYQQRQPSKVYCYWKYGIKCNHHNLLICAVATAVLLSIKRDSTCNMKRYIILVFKLEEILPPFQVCMLYMFVQKVVPTCWSCWYGGRKRCYVLSDVLPNLSIRFGVWASSKCMAINKCHETGWGLFPCLAVEWAISYCPISRMPSIIWHAPKITLTSTG